MSSIEKIKKFLEEIDDENIKFKKHFYDRIMDRPISEELIRKYIKKTECLLFVEEQPSKSIDEEKYKLWIRLSNQYLLVIIAVISKKDLYIVTSWNTNRKWKKIMQK